MDNEPAPVSGVFDKLKGKAKEAAGTLLGRDELKDEGRLYQEKADAEREAATQAAVAHHSTEAAEVVSRQQELAAEGRRLAAEEASDHERASVERGRAQAEAEVEADLQRQDAALHQGQNAQKRMVERDEIASEHERLAAEADASAMDRKAMEARRAAQALDSAANRPTA